MQKAEVHFMEDHNKSTTENLQQNGANPVVQTI